MLTIQQTLLKIAKLIPFSCLPSHKPDTVGIYCRDGLKYNCETFLQNPEYLELRQNAKHNYCNRNEDQQVKEELSQPQELDIQVICQKAHDSYVEQERPDQRVVACERVCLRQVERNVDETGAHRQEEVVHIFGQRGD